MPGLEPGIHGFFLLMERWMAGSSPAMTKRKVGRYVLISTFSACVVEALPKVS